MVVRVCIHTRVHVCVRVCVCACAGARSYHMLFHAFQMGMVNNSGATMPGPGRWPRRVPDASRTALRRSGLFRAMPVPAICLAGGPVGLRGQLGGSSRVGVITASSIDVPAGQRTT